MNNKPSSSGKTIAEVLNPVWEAIRKNKKALYAIVVGLIWLFFLLDYINRGQPVKSVDAIVIFMSVVTTILILYPLWSEIGLGGIFTVKKAVEDLKKDVNDRLSILQSAVTTVSQTVRTESRFEPHYYLGGAPDPQLLHLYSNNLSLPEGLPQPQINNLDIPQAHRQAFEIRYALEVRIRRLARLTKIDDVRVSLSRLADLILHNNEKNLFREIMNIVNPAVHGEPFSNEAIQEALGPALKLIATLDRRITEMEAIAVGVQP